MKTNSRQLQRPLFKVRISSQYGLPKRICLLVVHGAIWTMFQSKALTLQTRTWNFKVF